MKTSAYMIRDDGKEFPVTVHIYGNYDVNDVEETVFASEWLYGHTKNQETKDLIVKFLSTWVYDNVPYANGTYEDLTQYLKKYWSGVKILSPSFVKFISPKIDEYTNNSEIDEDLSDLNKKVNDALNNEFLRARNGGMYDSLHDNNGEMYFRVSSKSGFNWFDIIWNFVYKHKSIINSVTICKDVESLQLKNDYFYDHRGKEFNRMSVDDFLMMKGNPIVEKLIIC